MAAIRARYFSASERAVYAPVRSPSASSVMVFSASSKVSSFGAALPPARSLDEALTPPTTPAARNARRSG